MHRRNVNRSSTKHQDHVPVVTHVDPAVVGATGETPDDNHQMPLAQPGNIIVSDDHAFSPAQIEVTGEMGMWAHQNAAEAAATAHDNGQWQDGGQSQGIQGEVEEHAVDAAQQAVEGGNTGYDETDVVGHDEDHRYHYANDDHTMFNDTAAAAAAAGEDGREGHGNYTYYYYDEATQAVYAVDYDAQQQPQAAHDEEHHDDDNDAVRDAGEDELHARGRSHDTPETKDFADTSIIEQRMLAANDRLLPRLLRLQRAFEENAASMYRFCATHVLEWPSMAVEWLPQRRFNDLERDYTLDYLLVGTQTAPHAQNAVRMLEVAVPVTRRTDLLYRVGLADGDGGLQANEVEVDPGKLYENVRGHCVVCRDNIPVDSPVLMIRASPVKPNLVAVKTASGYIGVYNFADDSDGEENEINGNDTHGNGTASSMRPCVTMREQGKSGFGLAWSPLKMGYIAAGADDGFVSCWDVESYLPREDPLVEGGNNTSAGSIGRTASRSAEFDQDVTQPITRLQAHRDGVADVSWNAAQSYLVASAGMDGDIRLWDTRSPDDGTVMTAVHLSGALAAQFHPTGAYQLVTSGGGGEIALWDIRRPTTPTIRVIYHGRGVTGLEWSANEEAVLGSFGEDGRVVVWDFNKTTLPMRYSEDALAPPEVSFVHIGHLGPVTDMRWCSAKGESWLMASTDTQNGVHIYRLNEHVVMDYASQRL